MRRHASAVVLLFALIAGCGDARRSRAAEDEPGPGAATPGALAADAEPADAAPIDAAPAPTRPERAMFRLGDNLLTAHRLVGGDLVVDAGSIGFARYTRFDLPRPRWRLAQTVAGHRVATAATGASFELPLTAEQAAAARALRLRLVATEAARLTVKIDGRKAGTLEVAPGRAWYAVAVGRDRLVAGENPIVVEGGGFALETVRVAADPDDAAAADDPLAQATWSPATRELALADGAGLAWYVHLPPLAHLVADVVDPTGACRVEVSARADDGTRAGGLLGGDHRAVDLGLVADQAVRLELTARDCPRAVLADPAITIAGAAPAAAPDGPPPKLVILWIMDALRADRVRTFTPGARAEVPTFDALAQTGAVFRQYYVTGNESQTSHSTMWTGTYPAIHNVRLAGQGGNWKIPSKLPVIAELLAQAGLATVGVTGNGFVTDAGGYTRGFAEYRNMMREKGVINGILYGEAILAHALGRLKVHGDHPTFLFIGTIDTHGPWIARAPWIDRYDGPKPYTGPFQTHGTMKDLGIRAGSMGCAKIPPPRDIERLRAIYDSAISYQDARLGELVTALRAAGLFEQTMIVVTSDHGEELFEDGRCGHGASLRETLVRVPLLVHYPARVAPAVVDEGADGVDLLPTILDALDADVPAHLQGQSLLPIAAGDGRGWPRPSYASQFEYAHAMRIARWKLKVGVRGVPVVVDLATDPDERRDVSRARPAARRLLTDALGLFLATRARWHKRTMGVVTNLAPGAAELLERGQP